MTSEEKSVLSPLISPYRNYLANSRAQARGTTLKIEVERMDDPYDRKNFLFDTEIVYRMAFDFQLLTRKSNRTHSIASHPVFANVTPEQSTILLAVRSSQHLE